MFRDEEKRVIIQFVRVFSDGHAEVLQGQALESWLDSMKVIENMLDGRADVDPYRTFWVPIEVPKIKPKMKSKPKAGRRL
ncbi:MAG: hypothetical protein U9Q96_00515 [Patescibacteria group bacterium]|nr:hypothetical protein [Patescibacteria group bacterium]